MFKGSFKKMLAEKQVLAPCVWDCFSTKAVQQTGYEAALLSGNAVAGNAIGVPDLGIMTIDELVWVTERVCRFADIPIIIDADEGYGDSPLNVAHNIERLLKAGASGFTLDDGMGIRGFARVEHDQMNKVRNGELIKPYDVFSTEHWLAKVKAAQDVIAGTDCLLIARTECRPLFGLDAAIERCKRAEDMGAEMTLINRLYNIEEAKRTSDALDKWIMFPDIVVQPDGSQEVDLDEIYKLGFNFVTMHYLEKGAMYGMLKYGKENFKNRNTVYSELHDMGGLTKAEKEKAMLFDDQEWLDREEFYHHFKEHR